ncbi:hypothetical protein NLJ89_g784 [Agrocybe chaxingu]|uniref:Alpha-type protein kinase domain-containing protein n=1 Tax=Agrocybe chaxingu TaxID=84603 RepID=A0A9W8N1C7_9AGAR|nr:hypothetical protein NLJ89_g784 [Agrocybe chaxingu]
MKQAKEQLDESGRLLKVIPGYPPQHHFVVAEARTVIKFSQHTSLMKYFEDGKLLFVFDNNEWVSIEPNVPIRFKASTLLARKETLENADCPNLTEEIAKLGGLITPPPPPPPLSAQPPLPPQPQVAANVLRTNMNDMYVCALQQGVLALLHRATDNDVIRDWNTFFPQWRYTKSTFNRIRLTFKKALVLDILQEYVDAGETPKGEYAPFRKIVDQKWSKAYGDRKVDDLYQAWRHRQKQPTPKDPNTDEADIENEKTEADTDTAPGSLVVAAALPPPVGAPAPPVPVVAPALPAVLVDATDGTGELPVVARDPGVINVGSPSDYHVQSFLLHTMSTDNGMPCSTTVDEGYLAMLYMPDSYTDGVKKRVHRLECEGRFGVYNRPSFAWKTYLCDNAWLPNPPDEDVACWIEAFQMTECRLYALMFHAAADSRNIVVARFEVLKTYFAQHQRPMRESDPPLPVVFPGEPSFIHEPSIMQFWAMGRKYYYESREDTNGQGLLARTLAAFSHFMYERSHHSAIFCNFEGFLDANKANLQVTSVKTHTNPLFATCLIFPRLIPHPSLSLVTAAGAGLNMLAVRELQA